MHAVNIKVVDASNKLCWRCTQLMEKTRTDSHMRVFFKIDGFVKSQKSNLFYECVLYLVFSV